MKNFSRLARSTRAGRGASARSGFTLIELLAVLVVLSILMVFLVPKLMGAEDVVKAENTRQFLLQIKAVLTEYEAEIGDYPPSSFTSEQGQPPNRTNLGAEALVVHLWSEGLDGLLLDDEHFVNTDNDESAKRLTTLGNAQLFELRDDWENPIAYFHRQDYSRPDSYITFDGKTGEEVVNPVRALMNETTERFNNPKTYQLISAGSDGKFGTSDDIGI